jgi:hypothetical protein
LRRGKENNRVIRQDVGAQKYVGVNVMPVDAGDAISAALRAVGARETCVADTGCAGVRRGRLELNCRLVSQLQIIKRRIGMQVGNIRSRAQVVAQHNLPAVKEIAKPHGETYLEYAKNYLSRRD